MSRQSDEALLLLEFCETDSQREKLQAIVDHGSANAASKKLGVTRQTVDTARNIVRKKAARRGWSPEHDMTKTTPDTHVVKGVSTLYDEDGKPKLQWVKTGLDHEKLEELQLAAVEALKEELPPLPVIKLKHKQHNKNQLNLYTLTDIHIGMLAWHEEGGDDWDLDIAEKTILDSFSHLLASSPPAEIGFFNQLGDGLHSDGLLPVTPTSKHILDQDGRFHKIVRTAISIFRKVIEMMLTKYKKVVVLMAQGNHDLASSVWLQELFAEVYDKNKRVEFIKSPSPFYAYRHGSTMLGFHHGHKAKPEKLNEIFVSEFRKMYGATDYLYIHLGHNHHQKVLETNVGKVEQHPTLAARDAYSSHLGYDSERLMQVITYDKEHGDVGRSVFKPAMDSRPVQASGGAS